MRKDTFMTQPFVTHPSSHRQPFPKSPPTPPTMTMKLLLLLSLLSPPAASFSSVGWKARTTRVWNEIVDADYERVVEENDDSAPKEDFIPVLKSNSLLDMTLEDNNVTFPFVDPESQQTLNCRLAVTAELEDQETYAVGIPSQNGVLMVVERGDDHLEYIDPDKDDNVEILEIMAGALQKYLGEDLKLQRTPRILTITGDLDKYVDAFPASLVSDELTLENIMEEPDDDLDKLFDFFKQQLGDEEYDKALGEATDLPPDLQSLFETSDGDETPLSPADLEEAFRKLGDDLQHEGVGVKLVGFQVNNNDEKNKSKDPPSFYSLVKPVKPLTVVGRLNTEGREAIFELLTPEEEALVVPRLEKVCKEDMEAQGLL